MNLCKEQWEQIPFTSEHQFMLGVCFRCGMRLTEYLEDLNTRFAAKIVETSHE